MDIKNIIVSSRDDRNWLRRFRTRFLNPSPGEDVAAKRYFSHNPRNSGQVLPDFAPIHVNAALARATRIVRLQPPTTAIYLDASIYTCMYNDTYIYISRAWHSTHRILAEGSCRILMEVLPPSSDLWSQTAGGSSVERLAKEEEKSTPRGWRGGWKSLRRRAPIANLING